ncbi:hypothetical protein [Streptomyces sp. 7N604]|uniref:hypothetical protein n=1 Tax=Streptomyces sp. 7N604 TaxID=3457415 RepID=UPI003FD500B9
MNGRLPVTTAYNESSTERIPGRSWTVRLTGHSDRTASVSCSTVACRMPPRSRNLAALRTFAAQHAAAHARAATIRPNASCHCRAQHCAAHQAKVRCAGGVVMILRHDPTVGREWTVEEVCESCAPLIAHATIVGRADRARSAATTKPAKKVPTPARSSVPTGFSSPSDPAAGDPPRRRRPRSGPRRPRRPRNGQGH